MITVAKQDEANFQVTVDSSTKTIHSVAVDRGYAEKLTGGNASTERLVEASFEFLLAREPNTSILRSFDLPVIGRYFPEYESTITEML